jgi:phage terminase large subunit-like protein
MPLIVGHQALPPSADVAPWPSYIRSSQTVDGPDEAVSSSNRRRPSKPRAGRSVVNCADRHAADCIVYESNFGGEMVAAVVKTAASEAKLRVNLKELRASRGKVIRAEPVAALYEQGKIHHVGSFPQLEDQLAAFTTNGFMGDGSPDRAVPRLPAER